MRGSKAVACLALTTVLSAGCGGGSSSGGGADNGFTDNVSGKWTGTITMTSPSIGSSPPLSLVVTIDQPVSNSKGDAQPFTGTVTGGGDSYPMSGTKKGNSITMVYGAPSSQSSSTTGSTTFEPDVVTGSTTLSGDLTGADNMSGTLTTSIDPTTSGSWVLAR